jgi:hypothetical protein
MRVVSLHQDIKKQMIEAMKARETDRLAVLRGLIASFTNEAISKKMRADEDLPDGDVLTIISRAVKQRKDSIEQFERGGRTDLAESEKMELTILESYLPQQMSKDEISRYIKDKLDSEGASFDKSKKGQFMGMIMKELKGKADGQVVKEAIDSVLA